MFFLPCVCFKWATGSLCLVCLGFAVQMLQAWVRFESVGGEWRWAAWAGSHDGQPGCDALINAWVIISLILSFLTVIIIILALCLWEGEDEGDEDPPTLFARLFKLFSLLVCVVLDVLGLVWVTHADQLCVSRHRGVLGAMHSFCYVHMALAVMVYIQVSGRTECLWSLLRSRAVKSPPAAPTGALEGSTRPVTASAASQGCPCCPICLDDFDDKLPIVATRSCRHAFHKQCLQEWLSMDVICPLCRRDLKQEAREAWKEKPGRQR